MIELKITANTAADFQEELNGLRQVLWGTSTTATNAAIATPSAANTSAPESGEQDQPSTSESPQPAEPVRRRGRPKKDAAATSTESEGNEAHGAEQAPARTGGATEAEEQASEDASATSSDGEGNESPSSLETQTGQGSESPEPVSDSDLQKFSARLAAHYGTGQKVFDLAAYFVDGGVPRPSNIKGDAARWEFIRAAEADTGLKYHG